VTKQRASISGQAGWRPDGKREGIEEVFSWGWGGESIQFSEASVQRRIGLNTEHSSLSPW